MYMYTCSGAIKINIPLTLKGNSFPRRLRQTTSREAGPCELVEHERNDDRR